MTDSSVAGAILLTAAVRPRPEFAVAVSDPARRLAQYISAINQWAGVARRMSYSLVVLETSGFDLSTALDPSHQALVLNHSPSEHSVRGGKGAIEAEAMESAVGAMAEMHSPLCSVFKVTGRLAVAEPEALLVPLTTETFRVRRTLDRSFCDTRMFGFTIGGWKRWLTGMQAEVQDSSQRYLEHVVAQRLVLAEFKGAIVGRYTHKPRFMGQSGTSGSTYRGNLSGSPARLMAAVEGRLGGLAHSKQW